MRTRRKPWAEAELNTNPHVIREPLSMKGKWKEYFKNDNPIYVEIGCGKGGFITENARRYKDVNFVGIERQTTVAGIAARKIEEDAENIAIICGNAEKLSDIFEVGELSRIYLNFSDPWPKKRWAKRRLTHKNFLESYKDVFGDKGEVFFKTDNRGLFEFSLNEFCADDWKLSNISLDLHNSDYEGNIMTEYEEKFSSKGMPIYRLEARFQR